MSDAAHGRTCRVLTVGALRRALRSHHQGTQSGLEAFLGETADTDGRDAAEVAIG